MTSKWPCNPLVHHDTLLYNKNKVYGLNFRIFFRTFDTKNSSLGAMEPKLALWLGEVMI